MQVCTSLQTDNHASTPPLRFNRPDALPAAQATASKHWIVSFTVRLYIVYHIISQIKLWAGKGRTLQREVRGQHADVVNGNLAGVAVVKVHVERLLESIVVGVVLRVAGRRTDLARVKTTELLTPVRTDPRADRQVRGRRRTNYQRLADTHTHTIQFYL